MRKYSTRKDIITSQLASNTFHINNGFGAKYVGLMMGMLGMQYSRSYGDNVFGTSSTHALLVDNNTSVAFSVAHTAMCYSKEHKNERKTNGDTRK